MTHERLGRVDKVLKQKLKNTQADLQLVGVKINLIAIKRWTEDQRKEASRWSMATQNGAIRPRPEHVPPPQLRAWS